MIIYKPFIATLLIISADVRTSVHELNLLWPLAQYSSNWKIIFKDWIHHCDPKLGVIRIHGWYFCSYTLLKHIWASCKIFCRLGDCKMHQNDLKCGDLVDFVASKSHFVLWKWFGGGRRRSGLIFGHLVKKTVYGLKWSQMDIISIEMDYKTPKIPENMYHTYCFMNT